jgi:DNA-binding NtrC family response regulator
VILCGEDETLEMAHLGVNKLLVPATPAAPAAASPATPSSLSANGTFAPLNEVEKRHILAALDFCHGNRTHAAKLLDISIRTLRNKINEYKGHSPDSPLVDATDPQGEERPSA